MSMFSGLQDVLCTLLGFLLGPWAWIIGTIVLVLGGLALLTEESKLMKTLGAFGIGIGIAMAAPKIMDKMVPTMSNMCSSQIQR